jgi:hypothetical protein
MERKSVFFETNSVEKIERGVSMSWSRFGLGDGGICLIYRNPRLWMCCLVVDRTVVVTAGTFYGERDFVTVFGAGPFKLE